MEKYLFKCDCIACLKPLDYPMLTNLQKRGLPVSDGFGKALVCMSRTGTDSYYTLKENFNKQLNTIFKDFSKFHKYYPCFELTMNLFVACDFITILYGNESFNFKIDNGLQEQ